MGGKNKDGVSPKFRRRASFLPFAGPVAHFHKPFPLLFPEPPLALQDRLRPICFVTPKRSFSG